MSHLLPCPDCARHVRASDPECVFCGSPLPVAERERSIPARPGRRLGRAATFAFGAAIAASGCGESHTATVDAGPDAGAADAGLDAGAIMAAYGTPPPDAGPPPVDAGSPEDAGPDSGADAGFFPPYGTPPEEGDHAVL